MPWFLSGMGYFKSEGNYLMAQAASECVAQLFATFGTHKKGISPTQLNTCRGVMFGASAVHTALGTQAGAKVANGEGAHEQMRAAHERAIATGKGNWLQKLFTGNDFFYRMGAQPIAAAVFSTLLGFATAGTYYRGPAERPVHHVSAVLAQVFNAAYCWANTSTFREKVSALPEAAQAEADAAAAAVLATPLAAGPMVPGPLQPA